MMDDRYDLTSVKLPKVGGAGLAALVRAMEGPLRGLLLGNLLKNAGVTSFRRLEVDEPPPFRPELGGTTQAGEGTPPAPELTPTAPAIPGERPAAVRDFAGAYRAGRTDPVAVAEAVLAAIEEAGVSRRRPRRFFEILA